MGAAPGRIARTAKELALYHRRVEEQLEFIASRCHDPKFARDQGSFGAEVEGLLLRKPSTEGSFDARTQGGLPHWINQQVLDALAPLMSVVPELLKSQFELNSRVRPFVGSVFSEFASETTELVSIIQRFIEPLGGQVGFFGILPTMRLSDTRERNLSASPRYRELNRRLQQLYGLIKLDLQGSRDHLSIITRCVGLEGVNTSFQVHRSTSVENFARRHNAILAALALMVAACASGTFLFGKDVGAEPRIPVFEAATRGLAYFDEEWATDPILLFRRSVASSPLLPDLSGEMDEATRLRAMIELGAGLHSSYPWNRPIPGVDGLRHEVRPLGAPPTVADMAANAAFVCALIELLADRIESWIGDGFEIGIAKRNFYEAARLGLEAKFQFPGPNGMTEWAADRFILQLFPDLSDALVRSGISRDEADKQLSIVEQRVTLGATPYQWFRAEYNAEHGSIGQRLHRVTATYLDSEHSAGGLGRPCGEWLMAAA